MRRWFLLSSIAAAIAAFLPTPIHAAAKDTVSYLSGTVKGIPQNTAGSFETSDPAELRFVYGKATFAVPYRSITDARITDPPGRHLWRVPVPKLGKSPHYLTLTFRNEDKPLMMTFKAPAGELSELVSTIEERRKGPQSAAARPALKTDQEAWWCDRYWRTNRNKSKWPSAESGEAGVPAAGTKY